MVCPVCGRRYDMLVDCVINQFWHDTMFVHMARINIPGLGFAMIPSYCGPDIHMNALISVDFNGGVIHVTQ